MKIIAALVKEQGQDFKIEELELHEVQDDEVLIKIAAAGVRHTDALGRDFGVTPYPVVLGHEGAGIVEKVGTSVTTVKQEIMLFFPLFPVAAVQTV